MTTEYHAFGRHGIHAGTVDAETMSEAVAKLARLQCTDENKRCPGANRSGGAHHGRPGCTKTGGPCPWWGLVLNGWWWLRNHSQGHHAMGRDVLL